MNTFQKYAGGTALAVLAIGSFFTFTDFSDGERAGIVTKLSHKGTIPGCKTWEGDLLLGGRNADSIGSVWHFTVSDPAVLKKVQAKNESGEYAVLEYSQPYWNMPCTTDTGYFIVDVR